MMPTGQASSGCDEVAQIIPNGETNLENKHLVTSNLHRLSADHARSHCRTSRRMDVTGKAVHKYGEQCTPSHYSLLGSIRLQS